MTNLAGILKDLLSPPIIALIVILLGVSLGKVKLGRISLGVSAVLLVALWCGTTLGQIGDLYVGNELIASYSFSTEGVYRAFASLGRSLFISSIALCAGASFSKMNIRKLKAFAGGLLTVVAGAAVLVVLYLTRYFDSALLLGMFAGGMTSTPALSVMTELCENTTSLALGYSAAYCFGLISVVLFVQLANSRDHRTFEPICEDRAGQTDAKRNFGLPIVFAVALLGNIVGIFLPIGSTGGMLASGIIAGAICSRGRYRYRDPIEIRTLGLVLFFVGIGVPAGVSLAEAEFNLVLLFGSLIPIAAIIAGYTFARLACRFSRSDALAIVSGGMTSSPAIGALRDSDPDADVSLYAISYAGALIALLVISTILCNVLA